MSTRFAMLLALPLALGAGCSSPSGGGGTGGTPGTGGTATGGTPGTGGTATGGTPGTGGTGGAATGGNSGTGGLLGTGGIGHTGGTTGTGGTATGGNGAGGGGMAGAGGVKGTGGGTGGGTAGGSGQQHWVGTWAAAPYVDTNSSNAPPISLSNSVIRQIVHASIGGSQIRFQISNLDGNGSLSVMAAHVALNKSMTSSSGLVDSTIDASTDKALMFNGSASVTIAANKEVWSDPLDFTVPPLGNVAITIALGTVPSTLTQHSGSRTTSYFQSGSTTVNAASMSSAKTAALWFFISAMDVMADAGTGCVVAIGDSITDGRGTTTDGENRWTDVLSSRLQAMGMNVGVLNEGIGATNLIGNSGTAAQARYAHDVLAQDGIKYVIVFEGVNDIHGGASASSLENAYKDLVTRGRAAGLKVYGGTITPFGYQSSFGGSASGYWSSTAESTREAANTWIKTAGNFDGFMDFDAALTDGKTGDNEPAMKAADAMWSQADGLHPGPTGYTAMGDAIDLSLFTK